MDFPFFAGRITSTKTETGLLLENNISPHDTVHSHTLQGFLKGAFHVIEGGKLSLQSNSRLFLEQFRKEIPAEDESDASYLDGEVTEYSDQETDSETDVENKPGHEEDSDSNSDTNVCIIHPLKL
ncbi:hypothetical protein AVEN_240595-1 [Araneus ventricosus]|uniref:Uncharacterized protein n=1 Tax=Araneus ventricosus TaxID=182803 RepID=A0A4Y2D448_ARAVE|nr:hypothetical protein AVEN_240595-1 [Araneus ventricosus]